MANELDKNVLPENWLPPNWTEVSEGGMATCADPVFGGIIDQNIVTGKWFVIPNQADKKINEFFETRNEAFHAYGLALLFNLFKK